ncbi:MAG TPA: tetratricopeptide repeat protein [Candidatus Kapabacteria bacterium]|nr:tetratricopeptide repeat protein [Candidatus Kapabacteria bacterium]
MPVIVGLCSWKKIQWLSAIQIMPRGDDALSEKQAHEIDRVLAEVAQTVCDCLGNDKKTVMLPGDNVSLYKLPVTGDRLFGREKELKRLDDAWSDNQTAVLALVAWGGVGKTARAECYRHMKDFANAHDDLFEAREIAELGHMELHLCDYHLEAGRLCEAQGKKDEAKEHFRDAKKLIAETGYGRRKKEKEIINYK